MSIKYSCAIHKNTIISENFNNSNISNNTKNNILSLTKCLSKSDEIRLFSDNENQYYIRNITRDFYILCLTNETIQKRIVLLYLKDVANTIHQNIAQTNFYQTENLSQETIKNIKNILDQKTNFYNNPQNDTLESIKIQIDETKNVMIENIDKILDRGEKIEVLCDSTTLLLDDSLSFKNNTIDLRRKMMWKNIKYCIVIIFAIILLILIILMMACNPNFSKCKNNK